MTTDETTPDALPRVLFQDVDGNRFHVHLPLEATDRLELAPGICPLCGEPLAVQPGELRFDELANISGPAHCCACHQVAGTITITI